MKNYLLIYDFIGGDVKDNQVYYEFFETYEDLIKRVNRLIYSHKDMLIIRFACEIKCELVLNSYTVQ
jgi:hypothetical protein